MEDEIEIPLALQLYLWKQLNAFTRPKLGKLHESLCSFCQHAPGHHELKESCKTFEKILVQNIRIGITPKLSDALKSFPRWKLIQISLPYIMHCSATLLTNKLKESNIQNFGAFEAKMLYTLHWILLDSAEECYQTDTENGVNNSSPFHYIFPLSMITLFVYLFAPICTYFKETDFQNYRLENGLRIWKEMWNYRYPESLCFTAVCKQNQSDLKHNFRSQFQSKDLYLKDDKKPVKTNENTLDFSSTINLLFPEMIPEENDEKVVEFQLLQVSDPESFLKDPTIFKADTNLLELLSSTTKKERKEKSKLLHTKKFNKTISISEMSDYISSATIMDVAVIQCLFAYQWQESGIYWALSYLYQRFIDIKADREAKKMMFRLKSYSLPNIDEFFNDICNKDLQQYGLFQHKRSNSMNLKKEYNSNIINQDLKCDTKTIDSNFCLEMKKLSRSERNLNEKLDNDLKIIRKNYKLERGNSLPNIFKIKNESLNNKQNIQDISINPTITVTEYSQSSKQKNPNISEILTELLNERKSERLLSHYRRISNSDFNVSYSFDEYLEIPGCQNFITSNGEIDISVIIRGLYFIVHENTNFCSFQVIDLILKLFNISIELNVLSTNFPDKKVNNDYEEFEQFVKSAPIWEEYFDKFFNTKEINDPFELILKSCLKIYRHLGCPHGCEDGHHGTQADVLRSKTQNIITALSEHNKKEMSKLLKKYVEINTVSTILEFFHGYIGFCIEPNSTLSLQSNSSKVIEDELLSFMMKPTVEKLMEFVYECKIQDNFELYHDIRQLICYFKEEYILPFRKVFLSGLIESSLNHKGKSNHETFKIVRKTEFEDDYDVINDSDLNNDSLSEDMYQKKKITPTYSQSIGETDMPDDLSKSGFSFNKKKNILTPRQSEKNLYTSTDIRRKGKIPFNEGNLIRGEKRKVESDLLDDSKVPKATINKTFKVAKRRLEETLGKYGFKISKSKDSYRSDYQKHYLSRKNSIDLDDDFRDSSFVELKKCCLVPVKSIFKGMKLVSFLLEMNPPGTVPEPCVLASCLDLPKTPVISKAALLLQCAYFVNCCNSGQWAPWMKLNFPLFKPSECMTTHKTPASGARKLHSFQRNAGKFFHQWAEIIGTRLEEFCMEDQQQKIIIDNCLQDEQKIRETIQIDQEEDFLDEETIRYYETRCPIALRFIACILLSEITTFLRETYRNLPKLGYKDRLSVFDKVNRDSNRRWSMAFSSIANSQNSAQSIQSIINDRDNNTYQSERKISFVLHEPDNESEGSSSTPNDDQEKTKKIANLTKQCLLRRGVSSTTGGSIKKRSLKLRRNTKENKDLIDLDNNQSKRKVSSISDRSDCSEQLHVADISGEESPGILSDDQHTESPNENYDNDETAQNMPWIKSIIMTLNTLNYECTHQNFCHPFCYKRNMRATSRLIFALKKVFSEDFELFIEKISEENFNDFEKSQKFSEVGETNSKPNILKFNKQTKSKEYTSNEDNYKNNEKENDNDVCDSNSNKKEEYPVLIYINQKVLEGFQAPLSLLLKASIILNETHYLDIVSIVWDLLLEEDREIVACAASLFILCSVKIPKKVSEIMHDSLHHPNQNVKVAAILKFQVLWKTRYQIWPRMEDGAHLDFKTPPSGIEFTLPSPKIGIESLPVVDASWMPQMKTKVEEVTIDQEHRALVTATKSRKKQQTELIKQALQAQIDKKCQERKKFLITTIPITIQAAHEPSLYHATGEDHEEVEEEQIEGQMRGTIKHLQPAHYMFPSVLCTSAIDIIKLLDDSSISIDGSGVYEIAYHVIWCCLVEDSALFLRNVFECLTRGKEEQMFNILRHLIRFIPKLPQQAAFSLYNYIIGYIMFYVRTPHEESQHVIAIALSVLWMVVHSVNGILFKDLKQILRKEQCDASILLTANVPSAKKIIVHGPQEIDSGGIPSQFPIQEDTQFLQILRESLDFFGIKEENHNDYYLIDYKTRQIHNSSAYVRDCYFFKRSQYPQLELVYMESEVALNALQKQELVHKFTEIGKVHLTWAILKNVDMVVQRVVFLHEELMKLPSFPRKAMESNLELYKDGELGKVLLGLDVLHKFMWVRLISRMFEAMAGNFAYSGDIHLFLDVLNGALILYTENACILRYVMATYINSAFHFKNIFANDGYFMIMPTLLKIYANHQTNSLVTTAIEFLIKQFYLLNRKPFILQLFGSVSTILDTNNDEIFGDANKVRSSCFFTLLLSLETVSPDPLNISELVKDGRPIQAIDFCYHDETEMVTILDCISLCVMVISYAPESLRSCQMLIILDSLIPCYLKHIQQPDYHVNGKTEKDIIIQLSIILKTLVNNCEPLTKMYTGPYRLSDLKISSTNKNHSKGEFVQTFEFEEDSFIKFSSEYLKHKNIDDSEDSESLQREFRRPRDILLSILSQFVKEATARITEINRHSPNPDTKSIELLDNKCHIRLSDVAHSLLKISPYDSETMACKGLKLYMNNIFPYLDWSSDTTKPALVTILKRLDKIFNKILKKSSSRRNTNWTAAAGILKGVNEAIFQNSQIIHWQYVKSLIVTCQGLIVADNITSEMNLTATTAILNQSPPSIFCLTVIKLILYQIIYGSDSYNLEHICGGSAIFNNQEKSENFIMHLIIPLCFRSQTVSSDLPKIRQADIVFALNLVLNTMNPITFKMLYGHKQNIRVTNDGRSNSMNFANREQKAAIKISPSLYNLLFLALKIIIVCFRDELEDEWMKIARIIQDLKKKIEASKYFLDFLDFITTYRNPLFILMESTIYDKVYQPAISAYERNLLSSIKTKLVDDIPICPLNKGSLILKLMQEMKNLKDEYEDSKITEENNEKQQFTSNEINRNQRPSLIELLKGNETRVPNLSLISTPFSKSTESKDTSENSRRKSIEDSDDDKPRLQRIKPESRKTFRLRRSQKTQKRNLQKSCVDINTSEENKQSNTNNNGYQFMRENETIVNVGTNDLIVDEDSVLSQTSSTCGYKESYSGLIETIVNERFADMQKHEFVKSASNYESSSAEYSLSDEGTPTMTVINVNEKESTSSTNSKTFDENTLI